jgi:hypothetical protein
MTSIRFVIFTKPLEAASPKGNHQIWLAISKVTLFAGKNTPAQCRFPTLLIYNAPFTFIRIKHAYAQAKIADAGLARSLYFR